MSSITENIETLRRTLPSEVTLVAVSKTYPPEAIMEAYQIGQRIFGENRPQELVAKYEVLPKDIAWHQIGGLQTNKVKYIAPFVQMIHSVESERLLEVIHKEALKNHRVIDILLEVRVAQEESKHGWEPETLQRYLQQGSFRNLSGVRFRGVMGVASHTEDAERIRQDFLQLQQLFTSLRRDYFDEQFDTLSMGMTSDYPIALACGSTMVRIGSYIFGARRPATPSENIE
ncbi:MAG: YggS family pyridoxal phosphate-dependent enzyme [Alistipes sp.]|nr:YggS family pyridoxal phosphate-dependent enzyme [Alistipes sp.]